MGNRQAEREDRNGLRLGYPEWMSKMDTSTLMP